MEALSLNSTMINTSSPRRTHRNQAKINKIPAAKHTQLALKSCKISTSSALTISKERWSGARCVASSSGSAIIRLVQGRERCREKNDVSELLECLEMEAIMGEDEGKDPKDYNRRAMIFDKSSTIFQALKEQEIHKGCDETDTSV